MIFDIDFLAVKYIDIELFEKIFDLLLFCSLQTRLAVNVDIRDSKCTLEGPTVTCRALRGSKPLTSYLRSGEEEGLAWEAAAEVGEVEGLTCLVLVCSC